MYVGVLILVQRILNSRRMVPWRQTARWFTAVRHHQPTPALLPPV